MLVTVLMPIVLLANGLAAGVLVGTQLGGWPLLVSLPPHRYVHAHAFFATRYDPFMPICFIATVAGDITLAFVTGPRLLFVLAALLLAGAIAVSLTKNVPVNRWVRALDPDDLPADFAERDPRRHWGTWNTTRAALSVAGLLANCLALALLL